MPESDPQWLHSGVIPWGSLGIGQLCCCCLTSKGARTTISQYHAEEDLTYMVPAGKPEIQRNVNSGSSTESVIYLQMAAWPCASLTHEVVTI